MQEFTEIQQFLIFMAEGAVFSFIFDFFRGIRKNFNHNTVSTHIEDIIFMSSIAVIFIFSIIYFSSGVLRFYIFLGISLGIVIYALTIGKMCVIIQYNIIKICKNFFTFLLKIIKKLGNLFKL